MRTRSQRHLSYGSSRGSHHHSSTDSISSSDAVSAKAVKEYMRWRSVDVSTKVLVHQPLEPSRALANRMYNERTMLEATVLQALQPSSPPNAATAPVAEKLPQSKKGEGKGGSPNGNAVPRASPSAPYVEGALCRLWTQACLAPFGVEALSTFMLPAAALATSPSTEEMFATVGALLYRQGRTTTSERKSLPPPMAPLSFESAEEIDVAVAVPFLIALAEQELRGAMPGLTPRATLTSALIALRVLKWELHRESQPPCGDFETLVFSGTNKNTSNPAVDSDLEGSEREDAPFAPEASNIPALSSRVARVASASDTYQLCHQLCKCVNRGLVAARRKGSRSTKTSLSSSVRVSTAPEASHRSQSHGSLGRDAAAADDGGATVELPTPLTPVDLEALVDPIFSPADNGAPRGPVGGPAVSAHGFRKALFALSMALWAAYEVAIPLANLLTTRAGSGATPALVAQTTREELQLLTSALRLLLADSERDVMADLSLDFAQTMVVEDFATILLVALADAEGESRPRVPELRPVPSNVSVLLKGHSIRGQGCTPLVSSLWMQSLDWTLQMVEMVVTDAYVSTPV